MIKKFNEYYSSNNNLNNLLKSIEKFKINVDEYDDNVHGEDNNIEWLDFNKKEREIILFSSGLFIDKDKKNIIYFYNKSNNISLSICFIKKYDDYYYIMLYFIKQGVLIYSENYHYRLDQIGELKYFIKCLKQYLIDDNIKESYNSKDSDEWEEREYNSKRYDNIVNCYIEIWNQMKKYKISKEEYRSSLYYINNGEYEPKKWLRLNNKEEKFINKNDIQYYKDVIDENKIFYTIFNDVILIDIVKREDDYYYVMINKTGSSPHYYKLDQLSELKIFSNYFNSFKKKIE